LKKVADVTGAVNRPVSWDGLRTHSLGLNRFWRLLRLSIVNRLIAFDQLHMRDNKGMVMAGVDEAGRGPLAGPVVAAAVVLDSHANLEGLDDSKRVPPQSRKRLFGEIIRTGCVGIGVVYEGEIDSINIYQASRIAMKKAILTLADRPDILLVDGKMTIDLPIRQKAIVGGDRQSASIAAASIIAKVYRDAYMEYLDQCYPEYGFRRHKGYPTRKHLEKLFEIGPSQVHRKSFSPVQASLERVNL